MDLQKQDHVLINEKKKGNCYLIDDRGKIEESEKIDKYLDLARELKKVVSVWIPSMGQIDV